jgi:hypothetical protein
MAIEAKIEDVRIDIDHDGSLSLQCDYREGGEPWPATLCHWGSGKSVDGEFLATFAAPEAWQHSHYVRAWSTEKQTYVIREFEK